MEVEEGETSGNEVRMIYLELFLAFVKVGLFSIGGGYAAIPIIESEVVVKRAWITLQEFTDLITIAEMTPGPVAINCATFVGIQTCGFYGALCATFGCIFPSCVIVSILAHLYYKYKNVSFVGGMLAVLRPIAVALVASAGLSIFCTAVFEGGVPSVHNIKVMYAGIFLAAFYSIRRYRINPILVMSLCGVVGLVANVVFLGTV